MRKLLKLATCMAASFAFAASAQAASMFEDFESEGAPGASQLNFNGFSQFTVEGQVDLIFTPGFTITCAGGAGKCVDLDGTSGPGALVSNLFSYGAGDLLSLSFDLGGNQRNGANDDFFAQIFDASDNLLANLSGTVNGNDPFSTYSLTHVATGAGSAYFKIGTPSGDNIGPVVDNISFTTGAVPEPATWAMMILGFGLVGGVMRRRNTEARIRFA